ncbi:MULTISPECIES: phosphocholine cytidylyltransferase family protein [unclassified Helicobacter]|uniref:phosphocholine cytidylyltransferase family protein n=1 Tax=unclassified Helicobacter TaxID=2593540 RepID=UPI000CF1C2F2|nr:MULTISPECIES: phosphocholine cytidylyltransferase family protein [unclassified Helicobacter]
MRALILAAGMGSRLMPLTSSIPKCMVPYKDKPLIDYLLEVFAKEKRIHQIALVGGYQFDVLQNYTKHRIQRFYENKNFNTTNMVYTLFCARSFLEECIKEKEDLIISYADIVFTLETLQKICESKGEVSLAVNTKWRELWNKRFINPLDDAETLKIHHGKIIEIGKKASSYDEIQGQYMGIFRVSFNFLDKMIMLYDALDKKALYDGKDFNNMFMTSFLQKIIDCYANIEPLYINGGWFEIDSMEDLKLEYD